MLNFAGRFQWLICPLSYNRLRSASCGSSKDVTLRGFLRKKSKVKTLVKNIRLYQKHCQNFRSNIKVYIRIIHFENYTNSPCQDIDIQCHILQPNLYSFSHHQADAAGSSLTFSQFLFSHSYNVCAAYLSMYQYRDVKRNLSGSLLHYYLWVTIWHMLSSWFPAGVTTVSPPFVVVRLLYLYCLLSLGWHPYVYILSLTNLVNSVSIVIASINALTYFCCLLWFHAVHVMHKGI
jgi:hypothetical protein